jgi:hypothetical protein
MSLTHSFFKRKHGLANGGYLSRTLFSIGDGLANQSTHLRGFLCIEGFPFLNFLLAPTFSHEWRNPDIILRVWS